MPNRPYSKITWLAGLLEGEATFLIAVNKYPRIDLEMCDLDIVQRARDIMDPSANIGSRKKGPEELDYKIQYKVAIEGARAVGWMMTLYTLMGNRRREKIREILQVWKLHKLTRAPKIRKHDKMINSIMFHRKVSREEAEKILQGSLNPENQTIN